MLIGLSIRFCIKDILLGEVEEKDVHYIISNTACTSEEDWTEIEKECLRLHWRGDIRGSMILRRLREAGRIIQPRLVDPNFMTNLKNGRWFVNDIFDEELKYDRKSKNGLGFSWVYGGINRRNAFRSRSSTIQSV